MTLTTHEIWCTSFKATNNANSPKRATRISVSHLRVLSQMRPRVCRQRPTLYAVCGAAIPSPLFFRRRNSKLRGLRTLPSAAHAPPA